MLGYPDDARLLILNADDFGMCQSVNEAIVRALPQGVLRFTTLMVPCPWALHAMHFLDDHPEIPFGVHLTAISDWVDYRWGPVTSREKIPSLIDKAGYFYNFEHMPEFFARVNLGELEMEFRAQIEVVRSAGLSEWALHPGLDSAELLAIEPEGNHIRQTDFDFLISQEAKEVIGQEDIILLDCRALQLVWREKSF